MIEIDGWTHSSDAELAHDARRSARLEADGYRVVWFGNHEFMNQLEGVFTMVVQALPPPDPASPGHPPHKGEGEAASDVH